MSLQEEEAMAPVRIGYAEHAPVRIGNVEHATVRGQRRVEESEGATPASISKGLYLKATRDKKRKAEEARVMSSSKKYLENRTRKVKSDMRYLNFCNKRMAYKLRTIVMVKTADEAVLNEAVYKWVGR